MECPVCVRADIRHGAGNFTILAAVFHAGQFGDASKVASYTFLVPVISVFVSSLVLGEAITAFLLIGLILIGLSIYLVNRRARVVRQA